MGGLLLLNICGRRSDKLETQTKVRAMALAREAPLLIIHATVEVTALQTKLPPWSRHKRPIVGMLIAAISDATALASDQNDVLTHKVALHLGNRAGSVAGITYVRRTPLQALYSHELIRNSMKSRFDYQADFAQGRGVEKPADDPLLRSQFSSHLCWTWEKHIKQSRRTLIFI